MALWRIGRSQDLTRYAWILTRPLWEGGGFRKLGVDGWGRLSPLRRTWRSRVLICGIVRLESGEDEWWS